MAKFPLRVADFLCYICIPYEQVAGSTTGNAERAETVARATFSFKGPFAPAAGLFVLFEHFSLAGP